MKKNKIDLLNYDITLTMEKLLDEIIGNLYNENFDMNDLLKKINIYVEFDNEYFELEKKVIKCYFDKNLIEDNFIKNQEKIEATLEESYIKSSDSMKVSIFINKMFQYHDKVDFFYKKYESVINSKSNEYVKEIIKNIDSKIEVIRKENSEAEKKALEKLALFIAIFSLVASNTTLLYKGTELPPALFISIIFIINGTVVLSIETLFKLIGNEFSKCYFIIPFILELIGIILFILQKKCF